MAAAIQFENVTKRYGAHQALNGLTMTMERGKVTALLGPNGAGKTTAVSLLLNLLHPTSGTIEVMDMQPGHTELRHKIGAMLQEAAPLDGLTVQETIQLFRSYYRDPLSLERLLDLAGLKKEAKQRASKLSGGQRRRLAFALCLTGDPEVIVLDEPTVGMDVESRIRFWEVIRTLADGGRTIVLTTHYLEEADSVADRIIVIAEGKVVAEGTPAELKANMPLRTISFQAAVPPTREQLASLPGVEEVQIAGHQFTIRANDTDVLLPILLGSGWGVSDIQIQSANLETVFRELTLLRSESK